MIKFGSSIIILLLTFVVSTITVTIVIIASVIFEAGTTPLTILVVLSGVAFGVPRLFVGMRYSSLAGLSSLYLLLNIIDAATFGIYGLLNETWGFSAYAPTQIITTLPVLIHWFLFPQLREKTTIPATNLNLFCQKSFKPILLH